MAESGCFIFVACQAGAEKALKAELARGHPELRFAFSRPGFVTFKCEAAFRADFELRSVFARAYGLTLARCEGEGRVEAVIAEAAKLRDGLSAPLRLHVFERDSHPPGEEPQGFEEGARADAALREIRERDPEKALFATDPVASTAGEVVLDVIVVEPETWWVGWHEHSVRHHAYPGGNPRIELLADAPSRAYVKLEEALLWSRAPVRAGDRAVEIGSAPGGASLSLLRRGLEVTGIDPGEMDPVVLRHKAFRHVAKSVMAIERSELSSGAEWLLLDMNAEPRVALFSAERVAEWLRPGLLGVLLTVKLNQWKLAEKIPDYLEQLREGMGLARVRATQLAHNRQELFVYGMTRRGVSRL